MLYCVLAKIQDINTLEKKNTEENSRSEFSLSQLYLLGIFGQFNCIFLQFCNKIVVKFQILKIYSKNQKN